MKKILAIALSAITAICAYSRDAEPFAVLRIAAPQKFTKNFDEFVRAASPETSAQTQMMIAMVMAQFGYPFFDGVDRNENAMLAFFENGKQSPNMIVALKANPQSAVICRNLAMQKKQSIVKDGWYAANIGAPMQPADFEAAAKKALECASEKSSNNLVLTFYPNRTNFNLSEIVGADTKMEAQQKAQALRFLKSFSAATDQIDSMDLSLNFNAEKISVEYCLRAKDKSELANIFNILPARSKIGGLGAIDANSTMVILSSTNNKRAADAIMDFIMPLLKPIVDFTPAQIAKIKEISKKAGDTCAIGIDLGKSEIPQTISVSKTSCSISELKDYFKTLSPLSIMVPDPQTAKETNVKISFNCNNADIAGLDAIKMTSVSVPNMVPNVKNAESFFAIKDGFIVQTNSKQTLEDAVKKLNAPNPALAPYAKTDSDVVMIANLKEIISQAGVKAENAQIRPIIGNCKFKKNAAVFSFGLDTESIAEIVKITSQMQLQQPAQKK